MLLEFSSIYVLNVLNDVKMYEMCRQMLHTRYRMCIFKNRSEEEN